MTNGQIDFEEVNDNSSLTESDSNGIGFSGGVTNLVNGSNNASGGSEDKGSHEVAELIRQYVPWRYSPAGCGGKNDEISYLRRMNVRWKLVIIIITPTIA